MSNSNLWYRLINPGLIDSPALLVFPDRVKQNIQTAIRMVGDPLRLRPHVKTHKSPDVTKLMQASGIQKFKCATIAEAEMLGRVHAKDVLLAYQPTGPKLKRFIKLIEKYPETHYSCLTDNTSTAKEQADAFQEAGLQVTVYIDLNVGMNRTGIEPSEAVIELARFLSQQESIKGFGLHVYDGHIRNPNFEEKRKEVNQCYTKVQQLLDEINKIGFPPPVVVVGGSPAFSIHCKREDVECSPGTFIYWDKGYADLCREQDFLPAAVLITRVISLPGSGLITTDLGHKSVAAENEISKRVFFPDDPSLVAISQSEEHLVLAHEGNRKYMVGDFLYGLPFHICPTVALYEKVLTIENAVHTGEWMNNARDRVIHI